jgi:hypothetical protein
MHGTNLSPTRGLGGQTWSSLAVNNPSTQMIWSIFIIRLLVRIASELQELHHQARGTK